MVAHCVLHYVVSALEDRHFAPIVMLLGARFQIQFSASLEQRSTARFKDWKLKLEHTKAKRKEQNVKYV